MGWNHLTIWPLLAAILIHSIYFPRLLVKKGKKYFSFAWIGIWIISSFLTVASFSFPWPGISSTPFNLSETLIFISVLLFVHGVALGAVLIGMLVGRVMKFKIIAQGLVSFVFGFICYWYTPFFILVVGCMVGPECI